jgi:hypothetical protein
MGSRSILEICCLLLCGPLVFGRLPHFAQGIPTAAPVDPGSTGPCATASTTVMIGNALETVIHYPDSAVCGNVAAPFPGIVFAHGLSMFGLSNGAQENEGNGAHLASWGYTVALPTLTMLGSTRCFEFAHEHRCCSLEPATAYLPFRAAHSTALSVYGQHG